ncbi:hypothetical protein [Methylobacterium nigriterrae]|uniref:hypothetical protein n=1 Tax=Methylobacterium nigriterrae TaxID=3127512 RepID=UPI0030133FED
MTGEPFDISRVPLSSLKRYLSATGWRRDVLRSGLELFSLGSDDDFEIVLSANSRARDAGQRLTLAIQTLTALQERPPEEVIAAIRAISYDIIRSRLPDHAIRHDTIKLGTAEEAIRCLRRILAASAHAELHSGPYFERVDTVAQRYADDCRFGHTFRGSFGFTIESHVGPNTTEVVADLKDTLPLSRRAVQRVARGLRAVEAAIDQEDPSKIVEGFKTGLNANACDELADLVEAPNVGDVRFEIAFSPEWGAPDGIGSEMSAEIRHARSGEVIREASKLLRHIEFEKHRTIRGTIYTLRTKENPSDLFSNTVPREVVIATDLDDFGSINVRVYLQAEDYLRALEAHRDGREIVVQGELERTGRGWLLENPRDFFVL